MAAKGITASCPGAKRAIGAAAEVTNGLGQVFLTALRPLADLTGVSAFAVEDRREPMRAGAWSRARSARTRRQD